MQNLCYIHQKKSLEDVEFRFRMKNYDLLEKEKNLNFFRFLSFDIGPKNLVFALCSKRRKSNSTFFSQSGYGEQKLQ